MLVTRLLSTILDSVHKPQRSLQPRVTSWEQILNVRLVICALAAKILNSMLSPRLVS